jgi:hypothetical protein
MHHAAGHLKSMVSLPDFACFVKALLAACLARETERMRPLRSALQNERIGDITKGSGFRIRRTAVILPMSEENPTSRGHRESVEFPQRTSRGKFHSFEYGCFGGLNCVLQELFQFLEEAGQAGVLL